MGSWSRTVWLLTTAVGLVAWLMAVPAASAQELVVAQIHELQGAAHLSPFSGQDVSGVEGVVIATHRFSRKASMTDEEKKEITKREKEINAEYSEKIADAISLSVMSGHGRTFSSRFIKTVGSMATTATRRSGSTYAGRATPMGFSRTSTCRASRRTASR